MLVVDWSRLIAYFLEGLAVAIAAFVIPQRKTQLMEVLMIGLAAMMVFIVLDTFSPQVAAGSRQGAGIGIGAGMVGFGEGFDEGFDESDFNVAVDVGEQLV